MAKPPDRDTRVELVAAALCEAQFHPGAWDGAGPIHRAAYRRDAADMLAGLDERATAALATVAEVVARAEANAKSRDEKPGEGRPG